MSNETAITVTEADTRSPETSRQVDVPDDCPRDESELFELVDDPGSMEEPGYGHGV